MPPPIPVSLLTDYGPGGEHVGALHVVLARECPRSPRIDLAHDIPPGDVRWGALTLARHAPALAGAVHLAVVDPGVGGSRRAAALALADGGFAVGPDNGLLGLLADAVGADAAVDLGRPPPGRPATFHGRDLFAPAAARLATGAPIGQLGEAFPPEDVIRPTPDPPRIRDGEITATVAGRDRFGNLSLTASGIDLAAARLDGVLTVEVAGAAHPARAASRFDEVPPGALLVYPDSNGALSVACRDASAWDLLGCAVGDDLRISAG